MSELDYRAVLDRAWREYGDDRKVVHATEISALVSTNRVYRLVLDDGSTCISKVSSYGSYFLFREDHERIHRWAQRLRGTRYDGFLAGAFTRSDRVWTYYDGDVWAVFYDEVARRHQLPAILTLDQVANLGGEMARFHRACAELHPPVAPTSKSIKSDAIHLYDLVRAGGAGAAFGLDGHDLSTVRDEVHDFLLRLEDYRYDEWAKLPVLIDWNLGNFSVDMAADGSFRLFSRWDYDWFRTEPRHLDFYFFSRVSSRTGDRTHFTYSPHTLLEPRFVRFLQAYHQVWPLTETDVHFLRESYRFFILNYVVREGEAFFRHDLARRLLQEAVRVYLPAGRALELGPLVAALEGAGS